MPITILSTFVSLNSFKDVIQDTITVFILSMEKVRLNDLRNYKPNTEIKKKNKMVEPRVPPIWFAWRSVHNLHSRVSQ